jgi:hypothetical protein
MGEERDPGEHMVDLRPEGVMEEERAPRPGLRADAPQFTPAPVNVSVNVSNNACQPPATAAAPAANRPAIVTQHQEQQTDGDRGSRRARHASNRQRRISQLYTRLPPPVDTEMRTAGEGEVEMPTADETMLTMFPRDELVAGSDAEMEEAPAPTPLAVEMADQSEESTMLTNFPQDELLMEQEERAASPSLPAVDMEESPEGGELVEMSREEVYTQPADSEWPALDGPAEPASAEQPAIAEDWSKLPLQYQPDQDGDQLMEGQPAGFWHRHGGGGVC